MYLSRGLAVWFLIVCAESVHGILRTMFLAPYVGDFQARRIGVLTGSVLILTIACLFARWIRADTKVSLVAVGLMWLVLTLLFELSLGRFLLGFSWERLLSDYDISRGGLLLFGLLVLALSPLIAARLRDIKHPSVQ
jgi:hypothetical protein